MHANTDPVWWEPFQFLVFQHNEQQNYKEHEPKKKHTPPILTMTQLSRNSGVFRDLWKEKKTQSYERKSSKPIFKNLIEFIQMHYFFCGSTKLAIIGIDEWQIAQIY